MQCGKSLRGVEVRRNKERGAIAVLMAFCLTILLGFAALGFDLSYVRLGRLQMENATDAAAHAAMVVLRGTNNTQLAAEKAVEIAHLHEVMGQPMKLTTDDITFGQYNFSTKTFTAGQPYNSVRVNSQRFSSDSGNGLINLTFGRALGYTEADVTQQVTGAFANRFFQIELDITDSYLCYINDAADAAVAFLDYLNTSGTNGDWIGLDVFTGVPQQVTAMKNVKWKYNEIRDDPSSTYGSWLRNDSTLSLSQSKGIGVCSKSNGTPAQCGGAGAFQAGGWRQCPPNPPAPVAACASQFKYPNHSWMPLCSAGKTELTTLGLYAGTDLAEAIKVGTAKLSAAGSQSEPRVLILITDGAPMACTGPGGGDLCGRGGGPQPCCANGLTCGASWTAMDGKSYGGGAFGDGSPDNGGSGTITAPATATGGTACYEARLMLTDAIKEANKAAAKNIDLFIIGFYDAGSKGEAFAKSLKRNNGEAFITKDSTKFAEYLKKIPDQVPISIVR